MAVILPDGVRPLTPRQSEFLAMFACGMTHREIGLQCFVSPFTVRDTLFDARENLGANNLRQAAMKAVVYGLLTLHPDGSVSVSAVAA